MGINGISNITDDGDDSRGDREAEVDGVLDEEQLRRKAARDDSERGRTRFVADTNLNGATNTKEEAAARAEARDAEFTEDE